MGLSLRLNIFKSFYRRHKTNNKAIDHLFYGLLLWLEDFFIDYKTFAAIERGLDPIKPPPPSLPTPKYSEVTDGETPLGGEMRLTHTFTHEESNQKDLQESRQSLPLDESNTM